MKLAIYGLILYIFLMLPPVVTLAESIMVVHMHMQMMLLLIIGMMFAPYLRQKFPNFFKKWNENGIPGILLFFIILSYWMVPRMMDDAIDSLAVEIFKFISFPFLAGVPLVDSWKKITPTIKKVLYVSLTVLFGVMAWVYISAPTQLCNNYLVSDQKALGWTFVFLALAVFIYFVQTLFFDEYE